MMDDRSRLVRFWNNLPDQTQNVVTTAVVAIPFTTAVIATDPDAFQAFIENRDRIIHIGTALLGAASTVAVGYVTYNVIRHFRRN